MNRKLMRIILFLAAILIITPVSATQIRAASTIKNINFIYDLDDIDLNTDLTEGLVQERLYSYTDTDTAGVDFFYGNRYLLYKFSDVQWYGIGDGTEWITEDRYYGFEFDMKPDDGFSFPESVKKGAAGTGGVFFPVSQFKGFTVSRNGETVKDAMINYNEANDVIRVVIPARPDISGAKITGVKDMVYNGKKIKLDPKVTMYGETLKDGSDFTFEYETVSEPGTYPGEFTGWKHYMGSKAVNYRILYKDVPASHNYSAAVYWSTDQGIAAGYSGDKKGYFGVADKITRGQVVMFLWRAAGKPEPKKNTQTFKDVPTKHAYYKAIQWAVEKGITGGYTGDKAGYFGPNDNCTRGQIAMFLWRYAKKPSPKKNTQTFKDVPVKHSFYKAIQWASEQGITAGYKDGTFGVNKNCTRGQCVTFLYRMME